MSAAPQNERDALAQVMAADSEEQTRNTIWQLVPLAVRRQALTKAQLSPVMAAYTLDQFTAEQRRMVAGAMGQAAQRLDMIIRAMGIGTEAVRDRLAARDAARLAELEAWAAEAHPSRTLPH